MIGKKIGKWLVLEQTKSKNGIRRYLCQCDCGRKSEVYQNGLRSGSSSQCQVCANRNSGKIKQSSEEKYLPQDMLEKRFGSWTVLGLIERRAANGGFIFFCQCDCGKTKEVQGVLLRKGTSTQCKKCSNKNNIPPCRFCKCKNHIDIDIDSSECDLMGFCEVCDKFDKKLFLWNAKSRSQSYA